MFPFRKRATEKQEAQALAADRINPSWDFVIPVDNRDPEEWTRQKIRFEQLARTIDKKFRRDLTANGNLLMWNFSPGYDADEHLKKLRPIMTGPVIKIQTKQARLRAWIYKCTGRDGRLQYRTFLNANYPEKRANWLRRSRPFLYQNEIPEMICILLKVCQWISDDTKTPMPDVLMQMATVGFVFDKPTGETTITNNYDAARKLYQDQQERYDFEKGKLVEATDKRGKTIYSAEGASNGETEEE